jgi:hypothetical protein
MRYAKENSRITVKFIDADTEKTILELNDRTWLTINDVFSDGVLSSIMEQELKNKKIPKNILVIAVGEFKLIKS